VSDATPAVVPVQQTTGRLPQVMPQAIERSLLMHQSASEQDPVKGAPQLSVASWILKGTIFRASLSESLSQGVKQKKLALDTKLL